MELYAGIDLHSNNNFLGINDKDGRHHYGKRLPNDGEVVLSALEPLLSQFFAFRKPWNECAFIFLLPIKPTFIINSSNLHKSKKNLEGSILCAKANPDVR